MKATLPSELTDASEFWISPLQVSDGSPAVTVVIPTYNAATTLSRAIRSVLGQSLQDLEIIVVDDASTDSSWTLASEWTGKDPRIRGLRSNTNTGKPIAMNRAASFARGKWLAVLDADDWYHPNRLKALITAGERRGVDMAADNQFFYDTVAKVVVGQAWDRGPTEWIMTFDAFLMGSNPYDSFNFGMLKPVVRTEFLRAVGLTYEKRARQGQDFLYLLQFYLLGGKALVSDMPYYYYTQPFGSVSQTWSHAARRRYDFQTAFDINQGYVKLAEQTITPAQLRHLETRSQRLKTLECYYAAKEMFQSGKPVEAVKRAKEHPAILEYAFRRLLVRYGNLSTCRTAATIAARSRRDAGRAVMSAGGI